MKEKYYVYYESNDFTGELIYNNDNLMWRYWAAKEMAAEILRRDVHDMQKSNETMLDNAMEGVSLISTLYGNYNYITQTLKKEWFR